MDDLRIIAGLGNPGKGYENTKHNVGFLAIDVLAERAGAKVRKLKFKALTGECRIGGRRVLLVKPQTFMNLSGESVAAVMAYYGAGPEALTVIYDDIDIALGRIRVRKRGSAGTHNGMRSVIGLLGYDGFTRVRIGIGKDEGADLRRHVISGFRKEDVPAMERAILRAADAVECILSEGADVAMGRFNPEVSD
ncbi:MAG: aminoacyl-tRNA hydrolase [Clostridiales Family XIII bacterium]|jgi:PTH1 family peptidyl-tRNA hydrolase|nr:aminoacyl-tRNA hydrolase [Clostridiales Family XIII bacterium]